MRGYDILELQNYFKKHLKFDLSAGFVVFLIAIPLCLGIALVSKVPLYSGLISGVIGGLVVGFLSTSSISISGPSAGMVAVVLMGLNYLGSFNTFLLALFFSGWIQFLAGSYRLGFFADYFPSSVIKGMMSAIGILLIIKQIPLAFTLSHNIPEFKHLLIEASKDRNLHPFMDFNFHLNTGATFLSLLSLSVLFYLDKKPTRFLPSTMVVIILATLVNEYWCFNHSLLAQYSNHLVNIPNIDTLEDFWGHMPKPNWSAFLNPKVYIFALLLAMMSSLESLLNISASERIDLKHRLINKNRELKAQGIGNILAGFFGGIPITSLLIRTSLNVDSEAKTKMASIFHGFFLLLSIFLISEILNHIPLCALASILIHTGLKLTQPKHFKSIYHQGSERFIPFITTIIAVVLINLPVGVLIGLILNLVYVLKYNSEARIDIIQEIYPSGMRNRLRLPQQTSFLNKASIIAELNLIPNGSLLTIDARDTQFIDKEIIELIQDFNNVQAPLRQIALNLIGFKDHYDIHDHVNFINVSTYDAQSILSPKAVLNILQEGNLRFLKEQVIHRSNMQDVESTAKNQHPIAVVLGCIDSRVPVETIFDMTFGDLFCIRIAGNVINPDILASLEYACAVVGAKLIVVLGHTRCGAIQAACHQVKKGHITQLLEKIKPAILAEKKMQQNKQDEPLIQQVTELNIAHSMIEIYQKSPILKQLIDTQDIGIVGANYNVETAQVKFSNYAQECQRFDVSLPKVLEDTSDE